MTNSLYLIPLPRLSIALGLVVIVALIHVRWSIQSRDIFYSTFRMAAQLIGIGLVLNVIFDHKNGLMVSIMLCFMLGAASWISLRPLGRDRTRLFVRAFGSIAIGGGFALFVALFGVLKLELWYEPRYVIPLAGMIFSNAMNSVSLAGDRFFAEIQKNTSYIDARNAAYKTSLLPILNAFFAVGLVSLPGMMTGQILAGVSPLIAVRYQIMIMSMVMGGMGISSALFLESLKQFKSRNAP